MMAPKVSAKVQAETLIRSLSEKGFSEREIARRGSVSRATVWNVLNPEARRGGVRESAAGEIAKNLRHNEKMSLLRDYGTVWVEPANKRERSKIGSYWRAVRVARESGDWKGLEKYRGKSVTVIDKGKRSKLKLMSDRDQEAFAKLEERHLLKPDEITRGRSGLLPRPQPKKEDET